MRRFALLALVAAGCGSVTGSGALEPDQVQLNLNRSLWRRAALSSYRYHYRRSCFCLPAATEPVLIRVERGAVAEVVYARTGNPVEPERLPDYPTVDRLFELVQDALDRRADRLTVSYEPGLGYPRRIDIDYDRGIADEELIVETADLKPVS